MSDKLLDEMRRVMERRCWSIRTEHRYCGWVKPYVLFHSMQSPDDLPDLGHGNFHAKHHRSKRQRKQGPCHEV